MLWLALALAVSLPARLSPTDQTVMAALRHAVAEIEKVEYPRQRDLERFERLAPKSQVAVWRRLQQRMLPTQAGSLDLAFALAYYRVDYGRNLHRLLLPYRHWRLAYVGRRQPVGEHEEDAVEDLPTDLEALYLKHHDPQSLAVLLDLQLDGAPAEGEASVLGDLWTRRATAMLRLASGSAVRVSNIEDMLEYVNDLNLKAAAEQVQPFARHPDPLVAKAAREVLRLLRQRSSSHKRRT